MSLTDEDKQWMRTMIDDRVRVVVNDELGTVEQRLTAGIDSKFAVVEQRLAARIDRSVQMAVNNELAAFEQRMANSIERLETKLLTAFHQWASPFEMRVRSHSSVLRMLDLELEQLTLRVEKLEPPQ